MPVRNSRDGFTVVELLVTIGVIGLLMSLLLAGIQSARASARRMHCLNNIRQLALACHEFEAAHRAFPRTVDGIDGHRGGISESLSPHSQLLPYLDQQPLFASLDLAEPGHGSQEPPASTLNPQALTAFVPVFVCPDDDLATGGSTNYRACMGVGPGVVGLARGREPENGLGPWRAWHSVRTAEVADGLSNTVLFGEKLIGDRDSERYTPWRDMATVESLNSIAQTEAACIQVGLEPAKHRSYSGAAWLFGGYHQTWYNHIFPPNSRVPDCGRGHGAFTARSFHRGGVNTAFVDGAGHFVSEGIDLAVWRAMATRRRGEVVAAF